ncbi:putative LRR receptor-like serine/threonine-protein kinase, partial [Corchorus capsularis]
FFTKQVNCGQNFPNQCVLSGYDSGSSKKPKVGIIVGIVRGCIILLLFGGLMFFLCKGRQK